MSWNFGFLWFCISELFIVCCCRLQKDLMALMVCFFNSNFSLGFCLLILLFGFYIPQVWFFVGFLMWVFLFHFSFGFSLLGSLSTKQEIRSAFLFLWFSLLEIVSMIVAEFATFSNFLLTITLWNFNKWANFIIYGVRIYPFIVMVECMA